MIRRFTLLPGGRRTGLARSAIGGVALGLLLAATATAEPLYPRPDPDPFYAAPADLAAYQPGDVLGVRALPPLAIFPGSTVTLVKFRSTNSRAAPIAATTTVLTPAGRRPGGPLLSYQHFINALGTDCAISHKLYGDDLNLTATVPSLNVVLAQGWSVALPDHLGPQFALGAARLGGQIVLDGIRAVRRLPALAVQDSATVLAGYSGGGLATAWAAALQPTYAPELELAGAAIGGAPMNMVTMAEALGLGPHPSFGLAMAAAIGLEREYPDRLPISSYLNPRGREVAAAMADSCSNEILTAGVGGSARDYVTSTSIFDSRDARSVVEENSLELAAEVPETPIFEWHSQDDQQIPVGAIENTVRRWCAAGVRVQTVVVPAIGLQPALEHVAPAVLGAPVALLWLDARVRGEPAPTDC
ncbi:lipase family protein [Nocardia barduliensis]|uniref:lipase family protein n=1 Tax=Nocardia barduliensis TaxID=2736643 RepID=UPI0028ABF8C6|nr:lipase family protein [Nocardia barduliensis]